jgi:hypothetical protein
MTSSANATQTSAPPRPASAPRATDDEILGIVSPATAGTRVGDQLAIDFDSDVPAKYSANRRGGPAISQDAASDENGPAAEGNTPDANSADAAINSEPENLRVTFDANPELRAAWHDANAYREAFATPDEARHATTLLADLNRMDALFFSQRPEDHAALARAIVDLDPAAFASLANAMSGIATTSSVGARHAVPAIATSANHATAARASDPDVSTVAPGRAPNQNARQDTSATPTNDAQLAFLNSANASAVEGVVAAIESQVERLLPAGVSKSARTRVVGEIYRELDAALRSNHQLSAQMREAFRSGSLDSEHQRAIVSMITSRARQALPGVAKRVLNEWTSTLVTANQERRTRQRSAEGRIDIAGTSGAANDGRRSMSPRDLDYSRLSDADILNL